MRFVKGLKIVGVSCRVELSQDPWSRGVSEFYYEQWVRLLERNKITHISHKTGRVEVLAPAQAFHASYDLEVDVEHIDVRRLARTSPGPPCVGSGRNAEVSLKLVH